MGFLWHIVGFLKNIVGHLQHVVRPLFGNLVCCLGGHSPAGRLLYEISEMTGDDQGRVNDGFDTTDHSLNILSKTSRNAF